MHHLKAIILAWLQLGIISFVGLGNTNALAAAGMADPQKISDRPLTWTVGFGKQVVDIRDYVSSAGYSFTFVVNPDDDTMYRSELAEFNSNLVAHSWQTDKAGWDSKSSSKGIEFGRRAFLNPHFDSENKKLYFISDVLNNETYNLYSYDLKSQKSSQVSHQGYAISYSLESDGKVLMLGREQKLGLNPVSCLTEQSKDGTLPSRKLYCDDKDVGNSLYLYVSPLQDEAHKNIALVRLFEKQYEQQQVILYDRESHSVKIVTKPYNNLELLSWRGNYLYYLANDGIETTVYRYDTLRDVSEALLKSKEGWTGWALPLREKDKFIVEFKKPEEKKASLMLFDGATNQILAEIDSYELGITNPSWIGQQTLSDGTAALSFSSPTGIDKGVIQIIANIQDKSIKTNILFTTSKTATTAAPCSYEDVYYETFDKRKIAENVNGEWLVKEVPRKIHAVLFRPTYQAQATQKAALVLAHGGPGGRSSSHWDSDVQVLCHLGYYVIAPNPRGSSGGGESDLELDANGKVVLGDDGKPKYGDFQKMNELDWGGGDYNDYEMVIKYLEETQGVPKDRVGIFGFSYGGYMTNWAITRPSTGQIYHKFNFAISMAGISDLLKAIESTVVPIALTGEMGDPILNKSYYEKSSPINFVSNANIPSLLIHGEQDNRLNVSESRNFYRAIRAVNPNADIAFVGLPDEGHGVKYLRNQKLKFQAMLDFLWRVAPVE